MLERLHFLSMQQLWLILVVIGGLSFYLRWFAIRDSEVLTLQTIGDVSPIQTTKYTRRHRFHRSIDALL